MIGIYKVTNQNNGKIYIGQSKDIQRRWREHHTEPFNKNCDAYNVIFYRAIRKHGIDNFYFEVIEECDEEQLNEREKYWIKYYNTYIHFPNSNGYNMTKGGEQTAIELKYDIDLIKKLWDEGKSHKEIYEITNYNHHILTRYLDYLSISSQERRRRKRYNSKPVYQYSLNGQYLTEYPSVAEAVRSIQNQYPKADTGDLCYACNGKINSAYGYIWSYTKQDQLIKKIKHMKVNQYDLYGRFIATYESQTEACKSVGLKNISSITNVCRGNSKIAGGYIWRYFDYTKEKQPDLDLNSPVITHNQYTKNNKIKA